MNQFVAGMTKACRLAAQVLEKTGAIIKPGITTNELNDYADDLTKSAGALSAPLGYRGYPKAICTSVNDVLCHGVPDDTPLKDGDIINVDVTVLLNGYHGDCSATYYVGSGTPPQIIKAAYEAMMSGIKMVRPGAFTGDIGWASENTARLYGMHTVNGIGGHGIGKKFHSDPHIPGCGPFGSGIQLRSGICITVEPIVCQNNVGYDCVTIPGCDITTCISKDKSLAAQFEHTVLITPNGYDILTLP